MRASYRLLPAIGFLAACAPVTRSVSSAAAIGGYPTSNPEPYCAWVASTDTTVYPPTMVDPKPTLRLMPSIRPPVSLARDSREHRAVLRFTVSASGVVDSASVRLISSTDEETAATAMASLLASRYWPGCRNGQPVAVKDLQQGFRYGGSRPG